MAIDINKCVSRAKEALDELDTINAEVTRMYSAFERIADIARGIDESNYKEASDEIFQIAFNNY